MFLRDDSDLPAFLGAIRGEVEKGLPNAKAEIDEAVRNQAFWDLDAEAWIPQRDSESAFDFIGREKRASGFLHECVEILAEDLYGSPPGRTFDVPAGDAFLKTVYSDNLIDALMQRSDELSTLSRVCAIQVDACEGDWDDRPITLRLWGRDEFHLWCHPNDHAKVVALVTIDRADLQTRYRLWTDESVETYVTEKAEGTAGGVVAKLVCVEPNTYRCIPFGFFWHNLPTRDFFPASPGSFLCRAEVRIDDRLSRLDESIGKHLNPIACAENVPIDFQPIVEPNRFIRFVNRKQYTADGFRDGATPRVYYVQATIDVAGAWLDLTNYVSQLLEAARVPLSAVRMEQSGTASGLALMAEQEPLKARARKRRVVAGYAEQYLARVILTAAGNHYGRADLVAAARKGRLTQIWPTATIPLPGPDRDASNLNAITMGTKSRIMIIMQENSCDRAQALEILAQIAQDRRDEDRLDPAAKAAEGVAVTDPAEDPDVGGPKGPADGDGYGPGPDRDDPA